MSDSIKELNENLLNRKNTSAVQQTLEQLNAKVYEQQVRIDTLQATLNSFSEKITSLEQMVIIQKVLSMGHGPSVK
jgi:uncharacterized coiled-coil protein SlyX